MKDSGVEWLGEVPSHWGVKRLKSIVHHVSEKVDNPQEGARYIALEHVESWTGRVTPSYAETADSQLKRFEFGDVLFSKLRPYLAKVVRVDFSGQCVGEFLVLRTNDCLTEHFLEHLLRSKPAIDWIDSSTYGARMPRADWQFLGSMKVVVPPHAEQTAIARFLDHATDRIDRHIRAKEKLIALLEEQKRVVIQDAVTGRIDVRTGKPYPAYKPSGIEWLGQVPVHWDTRPAKWHFREVDERSETGLEELLSVSHLTGVTPRREKNVTMFKAESNIGHKICRPKDIVINTMWAWMGALGIVHRAGIVSPSYAVYRPLGNSRLSGDYGDMLLRSVPYRTEYRRHSTGIRPSRLRLYPEKFLRIRLVCPPLDEQYAVMAFVQSKSANIDRASELMRQETDVLREFRTRLVADVVTGKLDVREVFTKPSNINATP